MREVGSPKGGLFLNSKKSVRGPPAENLPTMVRSLDTNNEKRLKPVVAQG